MKRNTFLLCFLGWFPVDIARLKHTGSVIFNSLVSVFKTAGSG